MTLLAAHRILIGAAVAFFLFYGGWEFHHQGAFGPGSALRCGAALLAAAALAVYLWTLRGAGASPGRDDRGGTR